MYVSTVCLNAVTDPEMLGAQSTFSGNQHMYYWKSDVTGTLSTCLNEADKYFNSGRTGHLATITTEAEMNFVVFSMGIPNVWIAAGDYYSEGTFRWMAGAEVGTVVPQGSGSLWGASEPNGGTGENCAFLRAAGQIFDVHCTANSYHCLIEFDYVSTVTTTDRK